MIRRYSLIAIAAAAFCTFVPATPARAQASKFLNEDIEFVVTINFRQIMESKLIKDNNELETLLKMAFEGAIRQNQQALDFNKALGFDPFRDLDSITFAGVGGKDQSKSVIVINGKFDTKKFAAVGAKAANQFGGVLKVRRVGVGTVYEIAPPNQDKSFFFSVANSKTILVTQNIDGMKKALTRAAAAGKGKVSGNLKTLLKLMSPKHSLSFVATKSALEKGIKEANNPQFKMAEPFVKQMEGLSGNVIVAKDIRFGLGVTTKNAAAAQELSQSATQGLLFANLIVQQQAQNNPQLEPVVDIVKTLRASTDGNTVSVRGNVPPSLIRTAIQALKQFSP